MSETERAEVIALITKQGTTHFVSLALAEFNVDKVEHCPRADYLIGRAKALYEEELGLNGTETRD